MSKVISYSLYGNNPFYINGAINNAKNNLYGTEWETWFYIYEDVLPENIEKINKYANKIIKISRDFPIKNGTMWRFLAINETNVEYMLVRDVDSIPTNREVEMVNEWLKSGKNFHIIRDAPTHQMPFLACSFGIKQHDGFNILDLFKQNPQFIPKSNIYIIDQLFLAHVIYPLTTNNRLVHDSYNHYELDGHITTNRVERFIGEKILENGKPEGYQILQEMDKNYIYFHTTHIENFDYIFFYKFMEQLQIARLVKKTLVIPYVLHKNKIQSLDNILDLTSINYHYVKLISLKDYTDLNLNNNTVYGKTNNTNIITLFNTIPIIKFIELNVENFNLLTKFIENDNSIIIDYMSMTNPNWHMEGCKFLNYNLDYFTVRMNLLIQSKYQNIANTYVLKNNIRTNDTLFVNNIILDSELYIKNILELKLKHKNITQILLNNLDNNIINILNNFNIKVLTINDYIIKSLVAAQCKYQLHLQNYNEMDLYGRWILEERKRYYFNNHYITTMEVFSDVY